MKFSLFFTILTICCFYVFSQPIIILENAQIWNNEIIPSDAKSQKFVDLNLNPLKKLKKIEKKLITPPLEWGKMESEKTSGILNHYLEFPNGFVTDITINSLKPNHNYVLTLNGKPNLEGNDLLPDLVPGMDTERFYDILKITTDSLGNYKETLAIMLKLGNYHARFYVKDTEDWKIVLYHDYFKFNVIEAEE